MKQDTGYRIQDKRYRIKETGYRIKRYRDSRIQRYKATRNTSLQKTKKKRCYATT